MRCKTFHRSLTSAGSIQLFAAAAAAASSRLLAALVARPPEGLVLVATFIILLATFGPTCTGNRYFFPSAGAADEQWRAGGRGERPPTLACCIRAH